MSRSGVGNAGNVKMRGRRKVRVFGCGCCWCIDDREQLMKKIATKETREALREEQAKEKADATQHV